MSDAVAAAGTDPVDVPPFAGVHGMVLVASGADAIVAQAAQALVAPWSPVPVFVHHGPRLPDFVSDAWRCVFISSGAPRRSDVRSVGKKCVRTGRSRWSQDHK